jgi:uroporphyrinogen decarboxylase
MFKRVRAAGEHVWYHVDGRVNEILPEFIEFGADVINRQVNVEGDNSINTNLRGKGAIRTGIDCQRRLQFGSRPQIEEEVHRTFEACGTSHGGLIACGEIGLDIPLENVRA